MLNDALEWSKLQKEYEQNNRIRIENIMVPEFAEAVYQCLVNEVEWELYFSGPDKEVIIPPDQLRVLPPEKKNEIVRFLHEKAGSGFAYYYFRHDLVYQKYPVLQEFYDGMLSEKFVGFIKYITGELAINSANPVATSFRPGCFLRPHDDGQGRHGNRLVAHVFGFTKDWQTDWGGLLHFLNERQDRIVDVLMPGFNTLSLFKVPMPHFVSQVSSYAKFNRLGISGWYQRLNDDVRRDALVQGGDNV